MSATPTIYPTVRRINTRRLFFVTPVALLATGLGILGAKARVPDNVIAPGVQVGNVRLAGKNLEEARALLQQLADSRQAMPVEMRFDARTGIDRTWTADAHKLGLGLDIPATLDDATRAGRENMLGQLSQMLTGSKPIPIPIHVTVDEAQLRAYLKQIAYKVNHKSRNARLKLQGNTIIDYIHDRPGLGMDVDGSLNAVAQAWTRFNAGTVPPTLETREPNTPPAATAAPGAVDPNAHQKPGRSAEDTKSGGTEQAAQGEKQKADEAGGTPATQNTSPESVPASLAVELLAKTTPAAITYEDIKQINGVLGSKETDIGGTANRHSNVGLAASRINGTILRPGEIFSYNQTVGPRDTEHGFKEAPEIVGGVLRPGIGGGVCQVSSTLFNAVLHANLKIVSRSHHAFPVHYVSKGLDATVVDGSIDFQFQNVSDAPVYIYGLGRNGVLTFRIFGKKIPGRQVEMVRGKLVIGDYGTETETDSSLPAGHREVKVEGHPRTDVVWYRVVKENGVVTSREPITTHYRAIPEVVIVGTRPRPVVTKLPVKAPTTAPGTIVPPPAATPPANPPGQ